MSIAGPPPELEWVTFVLVGEKFPRGDEDRMHDLGAAWRQLAKDIEPLADQLRVVQKRLADAGNTPGIDTAQEVIAQLTAQFDAANSELHSALGGVAKGARTVAQEIEHAKLMIIAFAGLLALSLGQLIFSAVLSMGAASPAAAAVTETFRQAAKRVLIRLLQVAIGGAVFMGGLDAAIQLIQIHILGTRDGNEFNWKKVGLMAGIGALAGAFGVSLSVMRGVFTRNAVFLNEGFLFSVVRNLTSEGMAEYLADLFTNKGKITDSTHVSAGGGALSGAVEGAIDHGREVLGKRRGGTGPSNLAMDLGGLFGSTKELDAALDQLLKTMARQPDLATGLTPEPSAGASAGAPVNDKTPGGQASTGQTAAGQAPAHARNEQRAAQWLSGKLVDHVLPAGIGTPQQHERLRAVWQLVGHGVASSVQLDAGASSASAGSWETLVRQLHEFSQVADGSYPAWAGLTHLELVTGHQTDAAIDDWQAQHPDSTLTVPERAVLRESVLAHARETYLVELRQSAAGGTPTAAQAQAAVAQRVQGDALTKLVEVKLVEAKADTPKSTIAVSAAAMPAATQSSAPPSDVSAPLPTPLPAVATTGQVPIGQTQAEQVHTQSQVSQEQTAQTVATPQDQEDHYSLAGGQAVPIPSGWYLSDADTANPQDLAVARRIRQHLGPDGRPYPMLVVHVENGRFRYAGREWTAAQFAGVISNLPDIAGQPIVLVSCSATQVASQLRDRLQVEVIAADAPVWSTVDGEVIPGDLRLTTAGRPDLTIGPRWHRFPALPGAAAIPLDGVQLSTALSTFEVYPVQGPGPEGTPPAAPVKWGKEGDAEPGLRETMGGSVRRLQQHVLVGNITDTGTLSGLHQWHPDYDEDMTFSVDEATYPGGVQCGHITPQPHAQQFKRKFTTLFPPELTWEDLLTMARQAYKKAVAAGPATDAYREGYDLDAYREGYDLDAREWRGTDDHGFPIIGRLTPNGEVSTFYPSIYRGHYSGFAASRHPFFAGPQAAAPVEPATAATSAAPQPVIAPPVAAPSVAAPPVVASHAVLPAVASPPAAAEPATPPRFALEPVPAEGVSPMWIGQQVDFVMDQVNRLVLAENKPSDLRAQALELAGLLETVDNHGRIPETHAAKYQLASTDLEWLRRASVNSRGLATWKVNACRSRLRDLVQLAMTGLTADGIPAEWVSGRLRQVTNAAPAGERTTDDFLASDYLIRTALDATDGQAIEDLPGRLVQAHTHMVSLAGSKKLDFGAAQSWLMSVASRRQGDSSVGFLTWLLSADLFWRAGEPANPGAAIASLAELLIMGPRLVREKVVTFDRLRELLETIAKHPSVAAPDPVNAQNAKMARLVEQELKWMELVAAGRPIDAHAATERFQTLTVNAKPLTYLMGAEWTGRSMAEAEGLAALRRDLSLRLQLEEAFAEAGSSRDATAAGWQRVRQELQKQSEWVPTHDHVLALISDYQRSYLSLQALKAFPGREELLKDLLYDKAAALVSLAGQSGLAHTPVAETALLAVAVLPRDQAERLLSAVDRQRLIGRMSDQRTAHPVPVGPLSRDARTYRAMTGLLAAGVGPGNRLSALTKLLDIVKSPNATAFPGLPAIVAEHTMALRQDVDETLRPAWETLRRDVHEAAWGTRLAALTSVEQGAAPAGQPLSVVWPTGHLFPGPTRAINHQAVDALVHARVLVDGHVPPRFAVSRLIQSVTGYIVPAFYRGAVDQAEVMRYLDFIEENLDAMGAAPIVGQLNQSYADVARPLLRLIRSDIEWFMATDRNALAQERLPLLAVEGEALVASGQITAGQLHRVYADVLLTISPPQQETVLEPSDVPSFWDEARRETVRLGASQMGMRPIRRHGMSGWIDPATGVAWWFMPAGLAIGSPMLTGEFAAQLNHAAAGPDGKLGVLIGQPGSLLRTEWLDQRTADRVKRLGSMLQASGVTVRVAAQRPADSTLEEALRAFAGPDTSIGFVPAGGQRGGAPSDRDRSRRAGDGAASGSGSGAAAQAVLARSLVDRLPAGTRLHAHYRDRLVSIEQHADPAAIEGLLGSVIGQLQQVAGLPSQLAPLVERYSDLTSAVPDDQRTPAHRSLMKSLGRLQHSYEFLLESSTRDDDLGARCRAMQAGYDAAREALTDWVHELGQVIEPAVVGWAHAARDVARRLAVVSESQMRQWEAQLDGEVRSFRESARQLLAGWASEIGDDRLPDQLTMAWSVSESWYPIRTALAVGHGYTGGYPGVSAMAEASARVADMRSRIPASSGLAQEIERAHQAVRRLGKSSGTIIPPSQHIEALHLVAAAEARLAEEGYFEFTSFAAYQDYWSGRVGVVHDVRPDGDLTRELVMTQAQARPGYELRLLVADGQDLAGLQEWADAIGVNILVTPSGADVRFVVRSTDGFEAVAWDRAEGRIVDWRVVEPAAFPRLWLHWQGDGTVAHRPDPIEVYIGGTVAFTSRLTYQEDYARARAWAEQFDGLLIAPVTVRSAAGLFVLSFTDESERRLTGRQFAAEFRNRRSMGTALAVDVDWPDSPDDAATLRAELADLASALGQELYVRHPLHQEELTVIMPDGGLGSFPMYLPAVGGGVQLADADGVGVGIGHVISTVTDLHGLDTALESVRPAPDFVTIHIEFVVGGQIRLRLGNTDPAPDIVVPAHTLALVLGFWHAGPLIPRLIVRGAEFADVSVFQQAAEELGTEVHWIDESAGLYFPTLAAPPQAEDGWHAVRPQSPLAAGPDPWTYWYSGNTGVLERTRGNDLVRLDFPGGAASIDLESLRPQFELLRRLRPTPGVATLILDGDGRQLRRRDGTLVPLGPGNLGQWFSGGLGTHEFRIIGRFTESLRQWAQEAADELQRTVWLAPANTILDLNPQTNELQLVDARDQVTPVDWLPVMPSQTVGVAPPLHDAVNGLLRSPDGDISVTNRNVMVFATFDRYYQELADQLRDGLPPGLTGLWVRSGPLGFGVDHYDGTWHHVGEHQILDRLREGGWDGRDEIVYFGPLVNGSLDWIARLARAAGVAVHLPTLSPFEFHRQGQTWTTVAPTPDYAARFVPGVLGRLWRVGEPVLVRGPEMQLGTAQVFAGLASPTQEMSQRLSGYLAEPVERELFFLDLPLVRGTAQSGPLGVVVDGQVVPIGSAELIQLLQQHGFDPQLQVLQVLTAYPRDRATAFAQAMEDLAQTLQRPVYYLPPATGTTPMPTGPMQGWLLAPGADATSDTWQTAPSVESGGAPSYFTTGEFGRLIPQGRGMATTGSAIMFTSSAALGAPNVLRDLGDTPGLVSVVVRIVGGLPAYDDTPIGAEEAAGLIGAAIATMTAGARTSTSAVLGADTELPPAPRLPIRLILLHDGAPDEIIHGWVAEVATRLDTPVYYPSRYHPLPTLSSSLDQVLAEDTEISADWVEVLPPGHVPDASRLISDDVSGHLVPIDAPFQVDSLPHDIAGSQSEMVPWQGLDVDGADAGVMIESGDGVPQGSGRPTRLPDMPQVMRGFFTVVADGGSNVIFGRATTATDGFAAGGPMPVTPWSLAAVMREAGYQAQTEVVLAVPFLAAEDPMVPATEHYGQMLSNMLGATVYAAVTDRLDYALAGEFTPLFHAGYFQVYRPARIIAGAQPGPGGVMVHSLGVSPQPQPLAVNAVAERVHTHVFRIPVLPSGWYALHYRHDSGSALSPAFPSTIANMIRGILPATDRVQVRIERVPVGTLLAPARADLMEQRIVQLLWAEEPVAPEPPPAYLNQPFLALPSVAAEQFEQLRAAREQQSELDAQVSELRRFLSAHPYPAMQRRLDDADAALRSELARYQALRLLPPDPRPGPAMPASLAPPSNQHGTRPSPAMTARLGNLHRYVAAQERPLTAYAALRDTVSVIRSYPNLSGDRRQTADRVLDARLSHYQAGMQASRPFPDDSFDSFLLGLSRLNPRLTGQNAQSLRERIADALEEDFASASPRYAGYFQTESAFWPVRRAGLATGTRSSVQQRIEREVLAMLRREDGSTAAWPTGYREALMEVAAQILETPVRVVEPVMQYSLGTGRPARLMALMQERYVVFPETLIPSGMPPSRVDPSRIPGGYGADPSAALFALHRSEFTAAGWAERLRIMRSAWWDQRNWFSDDPLRTVDEDLSWLRSTAPAAEWATVEELLTRVGAPPVPTGRWRRSRTERRLVAPTSTVNPHLGLGWLSRPTVTTVLSRTYHLPSEVDGAGVFTVRLNVARPAQHLPGRVANHWHLRYRLPSGDRLGLAVQLSDPGEADVAIAPGDLATELRQFGRAALGLDLPDQTSPADDGSYDALTPAQLFRFDLTRRHLQVAQSTGDNPPAQLFELADPSDPDWRILRQRPEAGDVGRWGPLAPNRRNSFYHALAVATARHRQDDQSFITNLAAGFAAWVTTALQEELAHTRSYLDGDPGAGRPWHGLLLNVIADGNPEAETILAAIQGDPDDELLPVISSFAAQVIGIELTVVTPQIVWTFAGPGAATTSHTVVLWDGSFVAAAPPVHLGLTPTPTTEQRIGSRFTRRWAQSYQQFSAQVQQAADPAQAFELAAATRTATAAILAEAAAVHDSRRTVVAPPPVTTLEIGLLSEHPGVEVALGGSGASRYRLIRAEVEPTRFVRSHQVRLQLREAFFQGQLTIPQAQDTIRGYADQLNAAGHHFPNGDRWHLDVEFVTEDAAAGITLAVTRSDLLGGQLLEAMGYGPAGLTPEALAAVDGTAHRHAVVPVVGYADVALARQLRPLGVDFGQLDLAGTGFDALAGLDPQHRTPDRLHQELTAVLTGQGTAAVPPDFAALVDAGGGDLAALVAQASRLTPHDVVNGQLMALLAATLGLHVHLVLPDSVYHLGVGPAVLVVGRDGVYTVFPDDQMDGDGDAFSTLTTMGDFVDDPD